MSLKQYVVRKYVMASNARHALLVEKTIKADEVWLDEDWKKNNVPKADKIGFNK